MRKSLLFAVACALLLTWFGLRSASTFGIRPSEPSKTITDADRMEGLLNDMRSADLASLTPISVEPFVIPPAGVDVMRVRLEETYHVAGVGTDTVELTGWIAAKHDNPRPADGETVVKWGTAIVDTEFIGLELTGNSKIFGPVRIHLNPQHRSVGQVGKLSLPLIDHIELEAAYSKFRQEQPARAAGTRQNQFVASSAQPSKQNPSQAENSRDRGQITKVMTELWHALSKKDARAVLALYAKGSRTSRGGVEEVSKQLNSVNSLRVTGRVTSVKVQGRLANITATGTNTVTDNKQKKGSNNWTANVQMEKQGDNWLITQERTTFAQTGARIQAVEDAAGKCLASISVDVEMPNLDLKMKTLFAVKWYSEVETIPPVGYTASVSTTPTPLIADGRQVGTLQSGAVKFREVVRQIPLEGTHWNQISSQ